MEATFWFVLIVVCVATCHTKRLFALGSVRSGKVYVGAIIQNFFYFVFCFLALFFLLFLFCCGPVCVVFLLLLFFTVFFAVLVRPFLCVYWCFCLVVFVFGLDKFK